MSGPDGPCRGPLTQGADIEGIIVIKRKLTKRKITPAASLYQRGVAVELDLDGEADPLSFERSRVVIYVEGQLNSKPVAATLEQKNRRFLPDTLVVSVGSTVSFPNLDPFFTTSSRCPSPASSTSATIQRTTLAPSHSQNQESFS